MTEERMMNSRTRAVAYIMLSAFFFNLMNICVRLAGDIPSVQKSFFRNLVAALMALVITIRNSDEISIHWRNIPVLLARSVFGTLGIICNFYAVDHLILANASILLKVAPFTVVIFSGLLLKEKVRPYQLILVIIAFIGCIFVVKPSAQNADLAGSLVGLAGGIFAGLAYTYVRKASLEGVNGTTIVLFFSSFSCISVLPWVITHYVPMSSQQLAWLLAAGLCAAGGQFTITAAYANAPSREISIYDYTQILWAALFGFIIFGDVPDAMSVAGYVLIIGAAIVMFLINKKEKPEQ